MQTEKRTIPRIILNKSINLYICNDIQYGKF